MNDSSTDAARSSAVPTENGVPSMDQRRLQLLSSAFKGSVGPPPNLNKSSARRPSVLTLTRRSDDLNNDKYNFQSKVHFGGEKDSSVEDGGDRRAVLRGILKGFSHLDRVEQTENGIRTEQPFQAISDENVDSQAPAAALVDPDAQKIQELLSTVEFRKHTEQSISRIDLEVNAERKWLKEHPQTHAWDALQDRVRYYKSPEGVQAVKEQNELADRFIDTVMLQGASHVNNLLSGADNDKERLVVRLAFALLDGAVDELAGEVCAELLGRSAHAWAVLNKSLVKALASVSLGLEGSSSRFWKMSGREHVLKGLLSDSQRRQQQPSMAVTNSSGPWDAGGGEGEAAMPLLVTMPTESVETGAPLPAKGPSSGRPCDRTVHLPSQVPAEHGEEGAADESGAGVETQRGGGAHRQYIAELSDSSRLINIDPAVRTMLGAELMRRPPTGRVSGPVTGVEADGPMRAAGAGPGSSSAGHGGARRHSGTAAGGDGSVGDLHVGLDDLQRLYHLEVRHWAGVTFSPATNAPIQVPSALAVAPRSRTGSAGVVTTARLFPQPSARYASALVCGLSNGRLAVYAVHWTGRPVELLAATAALGKRDQSPVVEVKAAPFGVDMVVSRTERGIIMIHHMNWALSGETATALAPSTRKKNTSWFPFSLFGCRAEKAPAREMPLLFRIDPADGLFVQPGLLGALQLQDPLGGASGQAAGSSNNRSVGDGKQPSASISRGGGSRFFGGASAPILTAVEEAQLLPTDACFHPSLTVLGTATSVVVATAGGDVVKYNMDHLQPTLASAVVYPAAPFVHKEFIHPQNAPSGFVLTAGVADKAGNRVFRELFHYHRHKVLLLEPVQRLSPYMLSLDETGRLAVWQYAPKCLEGKGWFRPHSTAKLSLRTKDLVPVPSSTPDKQNAQPEDQSKEQMSTPPLLEPPRDNILSQLKVREVFVNAETRRVLKWYSPVHDEARQVWVQYRSVEYDAPVLPEPDRLQPPAPGVIVDSAGVAVPASPNRFIVPKRVLSGAAAAVAAEANAAATAEDGLQPSTTSRSGSDEDVGAGNGPVSPEASAENETEDINPTSSYNEERGGGSAKSDHSAGADPAGHSTEQGGASVLGGGAAGQSDRQQEGSTRSESAPETKQGGVMDVMAGWSAKSDGQPASSSRGDLTPASREGPGPPVVSVQLGIGGDGAPEVEVAQLEPDGPDGDQGATTGAMATPLTRPLSSGSNQDESVKSAHGSSKALPAARVESVTLASTAAVAGSAKDTTESAAERVQLGVDGTVTPGPQSVPGTPTAASQTDGNPSQGKSATSSSKRALFELPPPPDFPETVFTERLHRLYLSSMEPVSGFSAVEPSASEGTGNKPGSPTPPTAEDPGHETTAGSQHGTLVAVPDASTAAQGFLSVDTAHSQHVSSLQQQKVTEWAEEVLAEQDLRFSVVKAKMTSDGTELVLLLASKPPAAAAPRQVVADSLTVYYLVPYLALDGQFSKSFPRLYLPSDTDAVLDFCVGPVAMETLTRSAFVLTRHAVRVFSLHSGREILTNSVPFVWDLASFAPTMVSLCASQRVLTLAALDDARVAVYLLQHCDDGSADRTEQQETSAVRLRETLIRRVHRVPCPVPLDLPALSASECAVRTVLNLVIPSASQHVAAVEDVQDIVEALVDHAMRCVDLVIAHDRRAGIIQELFDGNLGYIAPTTWPPPIGSFPALQLSAIEPDEAPLAEGDAFSPNAVSRERGRHRHGGKRKPRKHRRQSSAGEQVTSVEDSSRDAGQEQSPSLGANMGEQHGEGQDDNNGVAEEGARGEERQGDNAGDAVGAVGAVGPVGAVGDEEATQAAV